MTLKKSFLNTEQNKLLCNWYNCTKENQRNQEFTPLHHLTISRYKSQHVFHKFECPNCKIKTK